MMTRKVLLALLPLLLLVACPGPEPEEDAATGGRDAGLADRSATDQQAPADSTALPDTALPDTAMLDDAGEADAEEADAGEADAATTDASGVAYEVGGSITGLTGTLILQLNGAGDLSLSADGPFTFGIQVGDGSDYAITVKQGSSGQICHITNRSGNVSGTPVTDVSISCHALASEGRIASYSTVNMFAHSDGSLWQWGDKAYGVGLETYFARSYIAARAATPSQVHAVAAGNLSFTVLDSQGQVWAWGLNGSGQCGDGTTDERIEPAVIAGLPSITRMVKGSGFVLALDSSGQVWVWGSNGSGQLGLDSTNICGGFNCLTPQQLSGLPVIVDLAAGFSHSLLLDASGQIWASGENGDGQLGLGGSNDRDVFEQVLGIEGTGLLEGVVAVSAGARRSMAILGDGRVALWGSSASTPRWVTTADGADLDGVVAVANYDHMLALRHDGGLWAWGINTYGQIGDGSTSTRSRPVRVEGLPAIDAIATGRNCSFAVSGDQAWAWGHADAGRLGTGQGRLISTRPTRVQGIGGGNESSTGALVVAGKDSLLVLDDAGGLWAAGVSTTVGRSEELDYHVLVPVEVPASLTFSHVVIDEDHALALDSNGEVWAWGHNTYGALGDGSFEERLRPVKVPGLSAISAIAVGRNHSLALGAGGVVYSWGDDFNGSLGRDTTETCGSRSCSSTPTLVPGLSGVKRIAAHEDSSMALASDDTVWTWGANAYGLLGTGDISSSSAVTPVQVRNFDDSAALASVRLIEMGGAHAFAVDGSGKLWGWGRCDDGRLVGACGSLSFTALPVEIDTTDFADSVAEIATTEHTLTRLADGSVLVWGANSVGELGRGDTTGSAIPLSLLDSSGLAPMANAISVAAGRMASAMASRAFSAAVTSDGAIWAWGNNDSGQLGNGRRNAITLPARVLMGDAPLP